MKESDTTSMVKLEHLKILHRRMEYVSSEANSYSNRYLLGGAIAVIALLNTDLLMTDALKEPTNIGVTIVFLGSILMLSSLYFFLVSKRIQQFKKSYRKAKFKYEVLLYNLLDGDEIIPMFETSIDSEEEKFLSGYETSSLIKDHKSEYDGVSWWSEFKIPYLIVLISIVIKIGYIYLLK